MSDSVPPQPHVSAGMPALDVSGRPTSFFEFWPTWLMYLPVALQWSLLALRYRSLTLPLIANPALHLSGMVGAAKSDLFSLVGTTASPRILPWIRYPVTRETAATQLHQVWARFGEGGLKLPVVAKPDLGCRGAGVRLLQTEVDLLGYLDQFPAGASILFQQPAAWEAEAGVFYVRHPRRETGEITSLTLKYLPYVVGDGTATLGELVARDPRAGRLTHLYRDRHAHNWEAVIAPGQPYRLVFSASHCRGAVFRDGRRYITDELSRTLDRLFDELPGFHYGRLDIKFRDLDSLMQGRDFAILEINGASAESIHIWDRTTGFAEAIGTLLGQYRTLFELGHANRRLGHRPPGVRALWDAWRYERSLVRQYPAND